MTNESNQLAKKADGKAPGSKPEVLTLDFRYDKNGHLKVEKLAKEPKEAPDFQENALVYNRKFNDKNELESTSLDIHNPRILKIISDVVEYYPSHPTDIKDGMTLEHPFQILYHHWNELEEYRSQAEEEDQRDVDDMFLKLLLQFMDKQLGSDRKKAKQLLSTGYISFNLLWTLYRPGSLAIIQGDSPEQAQLCRIEKYQYRQNSNGRYLDIYASGTSYDGRRTGRHNLRVQIYEQNMGRTDLVRNLAIYPLQLAANPTEIEERLIERGKAFLELKGLSVKRYNGPMRVLRTPPRRYYSSDPASYYGSFQPSVVSLLFVVHSVEYLGVLTFKKRLKDVSSLISKRLARRIRTTSTIYLIPLRMMKSVRYSRSLLPIPINNYGQ